MISADMPLSMALFLLKDSKGNVTLDVPIDTNHIERQIRPLSIGRKNWLFCWTEIGAHYAGIANSLIASCKLQNIDPYTYLVDGEQQTQTLTWSQLDRRARALASACSPTTARTVTPKTAQARTGSAVSCVRRRPTSTGPRGR